MAEPIIFRQLSLAVRYGTVLFPFDTLQFLQALERHGFVATEEIGNVPFGARFTVSGIVARKAQASVRIDADKQVVGILSPSIDQTVEEYLLLEKLVSDEFGIDSSTLASFYEFLCSGDVKAKKSPVKQFDAHFANLPITQDLSTIIGKQSLLFGLRLVPKDGTPNSKYWFDIRIEPSIHVPTEKYDFQVVYRNSQRDDVLAFAKKINQTVGSLISVLEK